MLKRCLPPLLACWIPLAAFGDLSPFVLPWNDSSPGITDFSALNLPITEESRVSVDAEGHFVSRGRRLRFLGVNFASDAPFMPTHRADAVAARLAKFGVNNVRFHHLDPPWAVGGGLIRYTSTSSRSLQPSQLDRLHFLIARLRAHGIYSDVNLLTAREFRSGDGLGASITAVDWKDQHILAMFNGTALALQKEFATQLLSPINPYTGLSLAQDPAVSFVEILNENGLLQKWYDGALDRLPEPFHGQLQQRWNDWLASRHGDDASLQAAWKATDHPLGDNLLRNGDFASGSGIAPWVLEQHEGAAATAVRQSTGPGTTRSLRLTVTRTSTAGWHVQFNQPGLRLTGGQVYTLTFTARSEPPGPLDYSVMMAHDPWQTLGLSASVDLSGDWQTFTRTFVATATDANARVNFGGIGTRLVSVGLADVRLQPGGELGVLPEGTSLTDRNIPTVRRDGQGFTGTEDAQRDWVRCLLDLENAYYAAMVGHLRNHLGYQGLTFGTIMANSPAAVQTRLDVIDAHAYWQHPEFPGTPWDPVNWRVPNVSMAGTDPASTTLASLARQRLRGKPFTVTEYQHASPNSYVAEGPLLLAAYAALQDWDGIWFFDYGWGNDAPLPGTAQPMGRIRGYFDTGQHPARMANLLLAANLFRRGDISPARGEVRAALTPEAELDLLVRRASAWSVFSSSQLEIPGALALSRRLSVDYGPSASGDPPPPAPSPGTVMASDTGELRWVPLTAGGYVTLQTPRTLGAVGFLADRELALGDLRVEVLTNSLRWATLGLTRLRGDSWNSGCTALLVATARCENTGQTWRTTEHDNLSDWGHAPTLIETVPLRITFPAAAAQVHAWALDERGQRKAPAQVEASPTGEAVVVTRPNDATLWYEIEVSSPPSASFDTWRQGQFMGDELLDPSISGPDAAPAGDEVPNLVKYALGLPAKTPATAGDLPRWGVSEGSGSRTLWLTYSRRKDAPDIELLPWSSTALPEWVPTPTLTIEDDGVTERIRAELPTPAVAPSLLLLKLVLRQRLP